MDNQHKKIKGYRDLSQNEIDLMNEGKDLAESLRVFVWKLEIDPETDKRCVAIAKTNLQTGCHWVTHAIARPDSF
jgi:hypothetical protein